MDLLLMYMYRLQNRPYITYIVDHTVHVSVTPHLYTHLIILKMSDNEAMF
jgi:hypothetical protein